LLPSHSLVCYLRRIESEAEAPVFWTKKPPFCDMVLHTADTEIGEYAIFDSTVSAHGGIHAFFEPLPKDKVRKRRKGDSVLKMHCESLGKAKAVCEQHYLENGGRGTAAPISSR
jgi:hypothetical protein